VRTPKSYPQCKIGGKVTRVHRVVAEEKIGRPLRRGEVVHHVDGDICNNAPENLEVLNHSEHALIHAKERGHLYPTECAVTLRRCGLSFREIAAVFGVAQSGVRRRVLQATGK
jgi:DNA-directed RNA polymerase specialized sigma24 family protein